MALYVTLFLAGVLTILLPCILPLVPIVVGVSITGRSKWRPLLTVLGMLVSFVGFTFLLQVVLSEFVAAADFVRISTYYILLLFGLGFLTSNRYVLLIGSVLGGFFFYDKGWIAMTIAETIGATLVSIGPKIAQKIQQLGTSAQQGARSEFGEGSPLSALLIGLTLGLVWVPCAGPALGFAFALVRDKPGLMALAALTAYGLGTALPLLLVGYGGQAAVHSVRALTKYSGRIKQVAGALLILSALALQYGWFTDLQTWLVQNTEYGTLGTDIEERLFGDELTNSASSASSSTSTPNPHPNPNPRMTLPKITRAPEFTGLSTWHNSQPLTMKELKGKVVLVDFWTYSCINCIRTLPYMRGYWEKYGSTSLTASQDSPFVLVGIHTPEFVFEKDPGNVADAIKRHELTYPIAQDNNFGTWNAFANHYWPAKYLIDAEGYIRYTHFGEGAYEETDEAIAALLSEIDVALNEPDQVDSGQRTGGWGGVRRRRHTSARVAGVLSATGASSRRRMR
ncbi:MAG: cytochrome c biogenesis protein DipZ [Candidatus Peregrinibacteria bacterium]|nr:cytochrome c biogenesis protein DipZ [Candidatus Peregrinibacteria bacterium]